MTKIGFVTAALLGAVSLGFPAAAQLSPEMTKTVAAANKEGKLSLTWSGTTLGGAAGAETLEQAMNKMFGTKLDIQFAAGPSMGRVGERLVTELKAGTKASADVHLGSDRYAADFAKIGLYHKVPWTELLPGRITPDLVQGDGTVVPLATYVQGITYNTRMLPNPPKTLAEVLKPEFKGKFAANGNATGFEILADKDFWGKEKTVDYVKKFTSHVAGLMRCGDTNRVASGEFAAFLIDCGAGDALTAKAKGAPVDHIIPRDYAAMSYFYMGVPRHAANPNAAKVFISFMLTPEGQKMTWGLWQNDLHKFPGSQAAKRLEALTKDGITPKELPFSWALEHPEAEVAREEFVNILRAAGN
jgi:iron(III) transport system substrate-binding protein